MKRSLLTNLPLFEKPNLQRQLDFGVEQNGARDIRRLRVSRLLGELLRGLEVRMTADERTQNKTE